VTVPAAPRAPAPPEAADPPAAADPPEAAGPLWARLLVGLAAAIVILGLTVVLLFNPIYVNAGIRHAGSAGILGMTEAQAESASDRTLGEMLFGPGDFAFPVDDGGARFYDESEAAHLRDARLVLWLFLAVVLVCGLALLIITVRVRAAWPWRAIAGGAAILATAIAALGLFFTFMFDTAFELFHRVFFPGGNYSFDVTRERMVQLYPVPFWELTFTVGFLVAIALGGIVWFLARRRAQQLDSRARLAP
jgi:integral membrane protein (TIGR01906 family)